MSGAAGARPPATNLRIPEGASPASAAHQVMSTLRPICGALIGGVAAFGAVAAFFFLTGRAPLTPGSIPDGALLGVAVLSAAFFAVAPVVERKLRDAPRTAGMTDIAVRYQTGTIVGFALREAPGLLGLVTAMLGGTLGWAVGFALASVGAMAFAWPRRGDLEARLRRATATAGSGGG